MIMAEFDQDYKFKIIIKSADFVIIHSLLMLCFQITACCQSPDPIKIRTVLPQQD